MFWCPIKLIVSFFFSDISEADLVYTETLMARGKEDYSDKEIVILGNTNK